MSATTRTPLITEEEYQESLRKTFGEELAFTCNLPYEQRLQVIREFQRNFDTPKDVVWTAEGYTGPDLP